MMPSTPIGATSMRSCLRRRCACTLIGVPVWVVTRSLLCSGWILLSKQGASWPSSRPRGRCSPQKSYIPTVWVGETRYPQIGLQPRHRSCASYVCYCLTSLTFRLLLPPLRPEAVQRRLCAWFAALVMVPQVKRRRRGCVGRSAAWRTIWASGAGSATAWSMRLARACTVRLRSLGVSSLRWTSPCVAQCQLHADCWTLLQSLSRSTRRA
mmetsp:Transcript_85776/g.223076  ORF Transcript_85776/g.223076 Transcript_85776/m.223076 type:complete len:210 (+) Transcript_85776:571-1200(+)